MGVFSKRKKDDNKETKDSNKEAKDINKETKEEKETPQRRRVWGIKEKTLKLILEVSKESYPNEFAGLLRVKKGIISELILLPGTFSGEDNAIYHLHMLPIDLSIIGTVHSHPSGNNRPSGADLALFSHYGSTHIIVGTPYDTRSWKAYDTAGNLIQLEVVA
ncbi:MAG: Mov34/MPN/PAD-1 family protein [Thermoplasmata archaeon]